MIIEKIWSVKFNGGTKTRAYRGWFLFGFIPLYVRCMEY